MQAGKRTLCALALSASLIVGCRAAAAEMATLGVWKPAATSGSRKDAVKYRFAVPEVVGKRIYRAELLLWAKGEVQATGLQLVPPWYNSFDATALVRKSKGNVDIELSNWKAIDAMSVRLWVAYEAKPTSAPQVKDLRVFHRAGQTFITFREIGDSLADPAPKWSALKAELGAPQARWLVRYLVYRHDRPITAKNLSRAELLARVKPLSGYNVMGRSVDELIAVIRKRAIDDEELARRLARSRALHRYTPYSPEMGDVAIGRFCIEDGKPLPPKTGLYVHHPAKPGVAYYAVITSYGGKANTRDFSAENALARPVTEELGAGVPVLQGAVNVTVFFDYPGARYRYVQWAAPPLANLPNQYYNWGVFVPRDYGVAGPRRLSIFFHDGNQRYLKMPWPHRQDQVIIAPHDAPFASFGIGYNDALGTLRPFKKGVVRPFFRRRVDAVVKWAIEKFKADPARVSCGGSGYWGGTAALQYGIRRPGRIAYVMADGGPDPDPAQTPDTYVPYPWRKGRPQPTPRSMIDRVWGRPEWKIKAESGKLIWDEAGLPAFVRQCRAPVPYLSLGSGSMTVTWKQQTRLMLAYKESRNAFMSQFYWGGTAVVPLPRGTFEPRTDKPFLACWPLGYHPNAKFFDSYFLPGKRGYGGGSRLNDRVQWESESIVDTPDRLEMTIYSDGRMTYAGTVVAETTVRNAQNFKPGPGAKLTWSATGKGGQGGPQRGGITVGKGGMIIIPRLTFSRAPARLIIQRAN